MGTGRVVHAAIRPRICPECPFHVDGEQLRASLHPSRRKLIASSMLSGESFPCHMEAHGDLPAGPAGQRQCTGGAEVLDRMDRPNTVMNVALRLGQPPYVSPGDLVPWKNLNDWATT